MSILWAIAASKRHYETNDFATAFQTGVAERNANDVANERIGRHYYVCTWDKYRQKSGTPSLEKAIQLLEIGLGQSREARQGGPFVPII